MRLSPVLGAVLAVTLELAPPLASQSDAPHVPAAAPGLLALVPPLPPAGGFIADVPGVVPAEVAGRLNARIRALQDSGFGDVGMAVIPSVGEYTPAEVGVAIYRTWRIGRIDSLGSERRNLGVLLLLVPKELAPDGRGHCWITTGRGAEGVVTDAASAAICRERVVPRMRERDHGAALLAGLDGISARLHGDAALAAGASPGQGRGEVPRGPFRWWFVPIGVAATGLAAVAAFRWRRVRPRRCPECGARMQRLPEQDDDAALEEGQQVEERLGSVDYDVWRCTSGHETVLPYRSWTSTWGPCAACGRRTARTRRTVVREPTYSRSGRARDERTCESCGHRSVETVTLARLVAASSSSSGSGGGFSGGGGGGGGGFGGSGSTGGGGGGSSY
jgi:uncharacterized protein